MMKHYNYQSDFKIVERLHDGAPFRFTYYAKEGGKSVVAEYDGNEYIGCLTRDGELVVPIKGGSLNLGELKVKREYFLTDSDFADGKCDVVSNRIPTDIEIWTGPTDGQEEVEVRVAPAYQKGDKGDKMTYDDLTEEEKEDLAKKVIGEAEDERRAAEIIRQQNEVKREQGEKNRTDAFEEAQDERRYAFNVELGEFSDEFRREEQGRQNVFGENEIQRNVREDERVAAEAKREEAEALRASNEAKRQEAEAVREANEKRREETYKSKVDRDDNAPKLTAGFANNLVGRGEATEEEISFRPSGGETSIEDGTARIERLKGSTLVWNNLIPDSKFSKGTSKWSVGGGATLSMNDDGSVRVTTNTSIYNRDLRLYNFPATPGHKAYIKVTFKTGYDGEVNSQIFGKEYSIRGVTYSKDLKTTVSHIVEIPTPTTYNDFRPIVIPHNLSGEGWYIDIYDVVFYDLTKMFGAGNEPTTIEEFNARKPIGIGEYAYNEGELISTNVDEIKSVGFNAYNGTYAKVLGGKQYELVGTYSFIGFSEEIGGELTNIEIPSDKLYTPDKDGYIYAQGDDICIHLTHTGYRNGEYEPYKEFRRSIPISEIKDSEGNQLFPNGLPSVGSVYDEITTTKAIKRVNRFVLNGSESWSLQSINSYGIANFSTLTTSRLDGASVISDKLPSQQTLIASTGSEGFLIANDNTLYIRIKSTTASTVEQFKTWLSQNNITLQHVLAEPIEVDLPEPLNLDYEVSDFGTEEVLSSEPTTPMKADIVYQFNAVDRIRDNSRHTAEAEVKLKEYETRIKSLEDIVAALTQQTPSGEEATL